MRINENAALDVAGAYNGAGSMLHWVTPPLTSHLKHFLNTEFIAHLRLDSRIAGYIIKVQ